MRVKHIPNVYEFSGSPFHSLFSLFSFDLHSGDAIFAKKMKGDYLFSKELEKSVEWMIASLPGKFRRRYIAALVLMLLIILFSFYFLIS